MTPRSPPQIPLVASANALSAGDAPGAALTGTATTGGAAVSGGTIALIVSIIGLLVCLLAVLHFNVRGAQPRATDKGVRPAGKALSSAFDQAPTGLPKEMLHADEYDVTIAGVKSKVTSADYDVEVETLSRASTLSRTSSARRNVQLTGESMAPAGEYLDVEVEDLSRSSTLNEAPRVTASSSTTPPRPRKTYAAQFTQLERLESEEANTRSSPYAAQYSALERLESQDEEHAFAVSKGH